MKIDGGCHCGAITYEAEVDPEDTSICHCTDCQKLTGTAFRTTVFAERSKFHILSGEPATYVKTADSGARRLQAFCGRCGSPIYATSFDESTAGVGIRLGTVRQREQLVPRHQIWTRSALSWLKDLPAIPRAPSEPDD